MKSALPFHSPEAASQQVSAELDRVIENDMALQAIERAATAPTFAASLALEGVESPKV